jgi:GR25 family glycosyltransferase involved in LPS biosynthesis
MFVYLPLFLLFLSSLSALSKQDCLKKIENIVLFKEIDPIEAIYVINLDHRPEKFLKCEFYFNKYNLVANRFSAINGRSISTEIVEEAGLVYEPQMKPLVVKFSPEQPIPEQLEDQHLGRTCFYRHITPGAIGCYLSHISILKDAFDRDLECIWVLEDDFIFNKDPHALSKYIEELDLEVGKENWDILFTDDLHCFSKLTTWGFSRPDFKEIILEYVEKSKDQIKQLKDQKKISNPIELLENSHLKRVLKHQNSLFYLSCYPDCLKNFRRISGRWAIHSMIIKRSAIEKILAFYFKRGLFLPYDDELSMMPELKMYNLKEGITSFETLISDTSGL